MWALIQNHRIKRLVNLRDKEEHVTAPSGRRSDLELASPGKGYLNFGNEAC
jgi:hypothetical protein